MAVQAEGNFLHGQLAQLRQLLRREEVLQGGLRSRSRRINLPSLKPLAQVLGRKVDVDDLIGHGHHVVGNPFLDAHARRALDDVVQALQVLNVERGDDADAGAENLLDVLVAFRDCGCRGRWCGPVRRPARSSAAAPARRRRPFPRARCRDTRSAVAALARDRRSGRWFPPGRGFRRSRSPRRCPAAAAGCLPGACRRSCPPRRQSRGRSSAGRAAGGE